MLSLLHVLVSVCVFNRKDSIVGDTPHCQATRGAPRPLGLTGRTAALLPGLLRVHTPGYPAAPPALSRPGETLGPPAGGSRAGPCWGQDAKGRGRALPSPCTHPLGAPGGAAPAPAPRPMSREAGAGPARPRYKNRGGGSPPARRLLLVAGLVVSSHHVRNFCLSELQSTSDSKGNI